MKLLPRLCLLIALLLAFSLPLQAAPFNGWGLSTGYVAQDNALASYRVQILLPESRGKRLDAQMGFVFGGASETMSAPISNRESSEYQARFLTGVSFEAILVRRSFLEVRAGLTSYWVDMMMYEPPFNADSGLHDGWYSQQSSELVAEPTLSLIVWPVRSLGVSVSGGFQFGTYQPAGRAYDAGIIYGINLTWRP